jgi:uracil-DNA glycosylase family 4
MDINLHNKRNSLCYLKSADLKDENRGQIKKVLKKYFETIYDRQYTDKELDHYYTLFERGIIHEDELYTADESINNGKRTLKLNLLTTGFNTYQSMPSSNIIDPKEYMEQCRTRELSPKIQEFCHKLNEMKSKRPECQTCPLFNKKMVVLDTNIEEPGKVDVLFVGLNPGDDEARYNKTFIGRTAINLRAKIMKFNPRTKYAITNIIMCNTSNESDIGSWLPVATNCAYAFLREVMKSFPAEVIVNIGRQSMEFFKIPGKISKQSGKIFNSGEIKLIPLLHPSSIARQRNKYEPIFNKSWETIYSTVENLPINVACEISNKPPSENTQCSNFLNPNDMIEDVTPDLMLFDIVNLNNDKILKIYVNSDGRKKYQLIDYVVPVFIKSIVNWKETSTITDHVDQFVNIEGKNKYYVNKILREQLDSIKFI